MLKIAIVLILAACEVNSVTVTVTVTGPSKPLFGIATTYTCKSSDDQATGDYTWTVVGDSNIDTSSKINKQSVTIAKASTATDIKCAIGGQHGQLPLTPVADPATPKITQNTGFRGVFQTGEDFTLTCASDSYTEGSVTPTPTWSWFKDDVKIDSATSGELQIPSAAATNKGSYTCKISIGGKPSESSPAYQVKVIDSITPTIKQTGGVSKTFQIGGDYTMTCSSELYTASSGVAKPKWSWKKGEKEIGTAKSNELKVSNAKASDADDYVCSITMADVKGKDETSKSAKFTVVVSTELGVNCVNDETCKPLATEHKDLYTGTCTDNRCVCKAGAKPIPESCSGAETVLASLSMTLTVAMVIIGRLL